MILVKHWIIQAQQPIYLLNLHPGAYNLGTLKEAWRVLELIGRHIFKWFQPTHQVYWMSVVNVAYWPPTRPSCQNKKCTSVNNGCIKSKISGDQGRPWLSRDWTECEIVTLVGSRWTSNYYITPVTGSSDQLERRCWKENHVPAEAGLPGPRLSSREER